MTDGIGITLETSAMTTGLAVSSVIIGVLAPWAANVLVLLPTYSGISLSGGGFKALVQARSNDARRFLDLIGVGRNDWGCASAAPSDCRVPATAPASRGLCRGTVVDRYRKNMVARASVDHAPRLDAAAVIPDSKSERQRTGNGRDTRRSGHAWESAAS